MKWREMAKKAVEGTLLFGVHQEFCEYEQKIGEQEMLISKLRRQLHALGEKNQHYVRPTLHLQ